MPPEQISPELVLVDAELGARARVALPEPSASVLRPPQVASAPVAATVPSHREHHYPVWARITAALWLLVLGILIGGAAIPHAQDRPRVVPQNEDTITTVCEAPSPPQTPTSPGRPLP